MKQELKYWIRFAAACFAAFTLAGCGQATPTKPSGVTTTEILPLSNGGCTSSAQVLIVQDNSGSMHEIVDGLYKRVIANQAITSLATGFQDSLELGLMVYPGPSGSCSVGQTRVSPQVNAASQIMANLPTSSRGSTSTTDTLHAAKQELQSIERGLPQYVLLITDGFSNCGGNPVSVATSLRSVGIRTYVIGFGDGVDSNELSDIAREGGTGNYHQADNLVQLQSALSQIGQSIGCCGDGVVDGQETCDSAILPGNAGACPTVASCADTNLCTRDFVTGSPCRQRCANTTIPGCFGGCGNGALDSDIGELCDIAIRAGQPGSCPTRCDDGDLCTNDAIVGAACDARCIFTPIDGCVDGCGNGRVDADSRLSISETCDVAIPEGMPGTCPTRCDDGDLCTRDRLVGTDCEAQCVFELITNCFMGCGNGEVEEGEACDSAIERGNPGACPSSRECDDENPCTEDELVGTPGGCDLVCTYRPVDEDDFPSDGDDVNPNANSKCEAYKNAFVVGNVLPEDDVADETPDAGGDNMLNLSTGCACNQHQGSPPSGDAVLFMLFFFVAWGRYTTRLRTK